MNEYMNKYMNECIDELINYLGQDMQKHSFHKQTLKFSLSAA